MNVAALVIAVLCGAGPNDDEARAAELFRAAAAAYAQRDFQAAARAFEEANRRAPRGPTVYNAALAWGAAGETVMAANAFEAALRLGDLEATQRAHAQGELAKVAGKLGHIAIAGPKGANVSVAPIEPIAVPARIHLSPGPHELVVTFEDGSSSRHAVRLVAGTTLEIDVTPAIARSRSGAGSAGSTGGPASAGEGRGTPGNASGTAGAAEANAGGGSARGIASGRESVAPAFGGSAEERAPGVRPSSWVLVGATAIAASAAVVLGVGALSARDDFDRTDRLDREARQRASTLAMLTNIAWAAAGVSGAVAVYLIIDPFGRSGSDGAPETRAASSGAGVVVAF